MSNSQPVASKSMALSQRVSRTNIVNASRTLAGRSEVQNELTPLTVSALQSLAEEDPFLTEDTQRNAKNTSSINGTEVSEIKAVLERVVTQYSEIKSTLEQMLLKLNNLENKVEELSCQISTGNQNVGMPSVSRSSIKRSLFESFNVPQPIGSRSLCTTPPEDEIEVVPVPPKKIPKIELNSDDEADGFDHDFRVNEDGYVIVYTDGACEKNGRCGAKAGIGVWFGDSHPLNISEPVHGRATNNTAEIQAAVQALEVAKRAGVKRILVHTDSEFTINCITKWVKKWVKNNWKVASGADVKNKEDLILLLEAMKNIEVKWEHVRGHRGIHGNEMADRLARSGAERYKP
ncbi:Ribonuclease H1 [Gryllus bimaculatus]|nr:Ribonuclease H1 [Gryllus bimaculatus]